MTITQPPTNKSAPKPYMQILRVRPGYQKTIRVVSKRTIYMATHWTTHSVLCPGDECTLCQYRSARVRGWTIIAQPVLREYSLLEVAGRSLESWYEFGLPAQEKGEHPTFSVSVKNARSGMRFQRERDLACPELAEDHSNHELIEIGFLAACLARLYQLPVPSIDADESAIATLWQDAIRSIADAEARKL